MTIKGERLEREKENRKKKKTGDQKGTDI